MIVVASGLRLDAAPPPADDPAKGAQAVKDAAKPSADAKDAGETLHYKGTVVDKDTGKPIAGATVVVRRSILRSVGEPGAPGDPAHHRSRRHVRLQIPPDQSAEPYLYIELDVEHPDYATRAGFGYALSMIRKNEKLSERPFFETVELRPAKPITGRVETPEGRPAAGVVVLAYSRTDKAGGTFEYGSFAQAKTDAQGRFRLPITTPGQGGVLGPAQGLCPRAARGPRREARRHGDDHPEEGRVRDRPGPGCSGQADRGRVRRDRARARGRAGFAGARPVVRLRRRSGGSAETDADGRFTFDPVAPGGTTSVMPSETNYDGDRKVRLDPPAIARGLRPHEADDQGGRDPRPAGDPRLALGRDRGALGR